MSLNASESGDGDCGLGVGPDHGLFRGLFALYPRLVVPQDLETFQQKVETQTVDGG